MKELIIISKSIIKYIDYKEAIEREILIFDKLPVLFQKLIDKQQNSFFLVFSNLEEWLEISEFLNHYKNVEYRGIIISITNISNFYPENFMNIIDLRTTSISKTEFQFLIDRSFFNIKKSYSLFRDSIDFLELKDTYYDQGLLVLIGKHLTTQRDPEKLLTSILFLSKKITGADGGSIYLVDKFDNRQILKFMKSDTFSKILPYDNFYIELDKKSIAGYVALTGNVLNISDVYELSLNRFPDLKHNIDFDKKYNYRTKSMLIVPMKNHLNQVIGVIQLVNCKENIKNGKWTGNEAYSVKLETLEDFKNKVFDFDSRYEGLLESVAGQTAIAIENIELLKTLKYQFDVFVKAAVFAIESRDPSTSGHSLRVAKYCSEIALGINSESQGIFKDVYFDENNLKELEYACLLHDFGKVNIDYNILIKAKKLFPKDLSFLHLKLDYLYNCIRYQQLEHLAIEKGIVSDQKKINISEDYTDKLKKIENIKKMIDELNEPDIIEEKSEDLFSIILKDLAEVECYDIEGNKIQIFDEYEKMNLSVKKGSLNKNERSKIEKHVIHTYNFVNQIPWPEEYKNIPEITYKHHELLDGSGYPRGIKGKDNIPLQSRIITIADIFDALTAADRPYKKAVTIEKAIKILKQNAKENKIDSDVLDIFIKNKIYELID